MSIFLAIGNYVSDYPNCMLDKFIVGIIEEFYDIVKVRLS